MVVGRCELIREVIEKMQLTFLLGYLDEVCNEAEKFDVPAREEDVRDFLAAFCVVNFILHPILASRIASDKRKMIMWRKKLIFREHFPFEVNQGTVEICLDAETVQKIEELMEKLGINSINQLIRIAVDKLYNEIATAKIEKRL